MKLSSYFSLYLHFGAFLYLESLFIIDIFKWLIKRYRHEVPKGLSPLDFIQNFIAKITFSLHFPFLHAVDFNYISLP